MCHIRQLLIKSYPKYTVRFLYLKDNVKINLKKTMLRRCGNTKI